MPGSTGDVVGGAPGHDEPNDQLKHVRLCLKQFSAAYSVYPLPRLQPNSGKPEFGHFY
jgi:hypothetical protein